MAIVDWIVIIAYLSIILVVAFAAYKTVRAGTDFAISGGTLPLGIVTATLAAAYIGGSFSLGAAGAAFREGYSYFFALVGFPIATIAVGIWVAPKLRRYGAETVGDVMEYHYGQPARILTGIISVIVCAAILGLQILALGLIAHTFIGVSTGWASAILALIVIVYSTAGGLWADVRADVIHFAVLSVFIPIAILVAIHSAGSPAKIAAAVPTDHLTFLGGASVWHYLSLLLGFLFGETLVQPYAQRAFAGATTKVVRKSFIYAGLFGIVFLFATTSGGVIARAMFPGIRSDQAIPVLVARLLPAGLTGLVVAGFIAVIMSSASSFLNSTTVVVVRDLWTRGARREIEDRSRLRVQRLVNLVVGIAALVISLSLPTLFDILIVYYSTWAPSVIAPLLLGVLFGFRHRVAGIAAMVVGLAAMAIWTWLLHEPFGVLGLAVGLAANVITFFAVIGLTHSRNLTPPPVRQLQEVN